MWKQYTHHKHRWGGGWGIIIKHAYVLSDQQLLMFTNVCKKASTCSLVKKCITDISYMFPCLPPHPTSQGNIRKKHDCWRRYGLKKENICIESCFFWKINMKRQMRQNSKIFLRYKTLIELVRSSVTQVLFPALLKLVQMKIITENTYWYTPCFL